jgi:hypothetical protein
MDALTITLAVLATVRLTRLVVADSLPPLPAFRRWLARRLEVVNDRGEPRVPEPSLWTLVTCPWCISFWIGLVVLGSAALWGHTGAWRLIAGALSLSLIAGTYEALMARIE